MTGITCAWLGVALLAAPGIVGQDVQLAAYPARVTLDSVRDAHRFVVIATDAQGITRDVTADVDLEVEPPGIVGVEGGFLRPVRAGEASVVVRHAGAEARISAVVHEAIAELPTSFRHDVIPVLTRAGCNTGACHGAAIGKNGFGLSLFGYDPRKDHLALSREYRGRRIDCADPEGSLLLVKPTGEVRHKGGVRMESGDGSWTTLRDWVAEGAVDDGEGVAQLVSLRVEPRELVLAGPDQRARLVVTAGYSDGSLRDVTDLALMSSSSKTTIAVEDGAVVSGGRGEAFVLARFGHLAEVAQMIVLPDAEPWQAPPMDARNEIDALVHAKLRKLRLVPAPVCDDAIFVRRVYLDVIGMLPVPQEVRRFVADESLGKRTALVDALMEREEFPDVWAAQWADVLRIEADKMQAKGVHLYTRWLRESFRDGVPFDQIVRRLLTAEGSAFEVPEANYWVVATDPKVLAENAAQTFLGIRVQCAQCHNHPFERWTMDDYYGFAAFFGQVARKRGDDPRDGIVYDRGRGDVRNVRNGAVSKPRFLGGTEPEIAAGTDRRQVLADWLAAADNPWFARNVANRVWARFFGRGLVDPVDDVRVSNPSSHPDLHRYLGEKLASTGFDLRALVREICASATYQASQHAGGAVAETYAGRVPRRLSAEQLLDAISAVTEVPTKFRGLPLGASAMQIVGANSGSRFLDLFGRPRRETVCTCERREEPTLNQVLHLINGDAVEQKVRGGGGRLSRLLEAKAEPAEILEEIFLAAYARPPRAEEREHLLHEVAEAGDDARGAWEDLLWAVLNSKEFLFQH